MRPQMLRIVESMERCLHADEMEGKCSDGCRYGKEKMCREKLERDLITVALLLDEENQTLKRKNYDSGRKKVQ